MVMLHKPLLDPNAGSARTVNPRWTMVLRGVGATILATLAAMWPSTTFFMLVGVLAAYSIVDDLLSLMVSVE